METRMWEHEAVQRNVETLQARGVRLVGPESGALASGHEGVGRMAEPETVVEQILRLAEGKRDLEGLNLLVTAGPTREPLDPIRFVSNRSSGKMGLALAEAARDRGARVTLLLGPASLPEPEGVRTKRFETADELHALLLQEFPECDGLVMAAAVADFIPRPSAERLHRESGPVRVDLEPGRDILASLRPLKRRQTVIAFAAETRDLESRGRRKMETKGADLIVVNDVGRPGIGFDAEDNEVLLLTRGGGSQSIGRAPKREIADRIWDAFRGVRDQASGFSASTIHLSDSQPK
jgi:phosphopantothenoylcysteine decarboxylase/phosphopantothenate--cysteine ligase